MHGKITDFKKSYDVHMTMFQAVRFPRVTQSLALVSHLEGRENKNPSLKETGAGSNQGRASICLQQVTTNSVCPHPSWEFCLWEHFLTRNCYFQLITNLKHIIYNCNIYYLLLKNKMTKIAVWSLVQVV